MTQLQAWLAIAVAATILLGAAGAVVRGLWRRGLALAKFGRGFYAAVRANAEQTERLATELAAHRVDVTTALADLGNRVTLLEQRL